jgi:tetratricopeptide (TPR) repeat protein
MLMRSFLVTALALLLPAAATAQGDDDVVITKSSGVRYFKIDTKAAVKDGKKITVLEATPDAALSSPYYRTIKQDPKIEPDYPGSTIQYKDYYKIRENGKEHWLDKKDAEPLKSAVEFFTKKLQEQGREFDSFLWARRALAWDLQNEFEKALQDFTKAILYAPTEPAWLNYRGSCFLRKVEETKPKAKDEDLKKAKIDFENANSFSKCKFAPAILNLGRLFELNEKFDDAMCQYLKVISLTPNDPAGYNALAWLLATCSESRYLNGPLALEFAKVAQKLVPSGGVDDCIEDTLAAAYARLASEEKDNNKKKELFAKAIAAIGQALEYGLDPNRAAAYCDRMCLYHKGKAYPEN